jgi:chemotaxis protein CheY-P-specific phosphatase CheC
MAEQDPKKLADENKLLKEQLDLLKNRNKLQEESFNISSSSLDSLKELLGITSRRSTFEAATLKTNKDINAAILNQKTGLSDISNIQKQIQKNEDLLKKK